jgi:hypothetical protein
MRSKNVEDEMILTSHLPDSLFWQNINETAICCINAESISPPDRGIVIDVLN